MEFESLARLLKFDPVNRQLRTDCINAAFQNRDYQAVRSLTDEVLEKSPDDVEMAFAKSNALIGLKEHNSAIELLSRIQALDPLNPAIAQNLALCFYITGNFAAAREQAEAVYAADNRSVDVVRILVSSCHHLGLMERAVAVADENKELAKTDGALAGVYALLYSDDLRMIDAKKYATYSLRLNPNNIDALTTDATLRLASGDVEAAEATYAKLNDLNPNMGRVHLGLGSIALLRQDFTKAKEIIERALELMPDHVGTWHLLGWTHLVEGDLDEAERVFNKALELNRNFSESHGALASIAALRGDQATAEELIKIATRLDPESLARRLAQSILAAKSNNQQEAQRIIEEGLKQIAAGDGGAVVKMLTNAARKAPKA